MGVRERFQPTVSEGTGQPLAACPKCGSPAVRLEYNYFEGKQGGPKYASNRLVRHHYAMISCSRDCSCYHSHSKLVFEDNEYWAPYTRYRFYHDSEIWKRLEDDWNKKTAAYIETHGEPGTNITGPKNYIDHGGKAVSGTGRSLLSCPKCGAPAVRVEYDYKCVGGWQRHEGQVRCSRDNSCYHAVGAFEFPDNKNSKGTKYVYPAGYSGWSSFSTDEQGEMWQFVEDEWNKCVENYKAKREPKPNPNSKKCACGYAVNDGFLFCPMCGKPARDVNERVM